MLLLLLKIEITEREHAWAEKLADCCTADTSLFLLREAVAVCRRGVPRRGVGVASVDEDMFNLWKTTLHSINGSKVD